MRLINKHDAHFMTVVVLLAILIAVVGFVVGYTAATDRTKPPPCPTFEEELEECEEDNKYHAHLHREYREGWHDCQRDLNKYAKASVEVFCLEAITEAWYELDAELDESYECNLRLSNCLLEVRNAQ